MKRIFVSGAITGRINNNEGAFNDASKIIRADGHIAIVPHEIMLQVDTSGFSHNDYCKLCCAHLLTCDEMVQVSGWQNSRGAALEKAVCDLFNIPYKTIEEYCKDNGG